ncbi:MAG: DUF5309 family protein [Fervidobacterium sp.]
MPFSTGSITSYNVSDNKVQIDDVFNMLKLPETPLLNVTKTGDKIDSTILQWYEDVPVPLVVKLASPHTSGSDSLVVDDGTVIKVGNILKVQSTLYRVTAKNVNNLNNLTVVALNTDNAYPKDESVFIVSDANVEAFSPEESAISQRVNRENVTQIFSETLQISGTQKELKQWVKNYNLWADETQRKLERLRVLMERTLINGVHHKPTDNNTPRLAGGIDYFITKYGFCGTGALDEANFKAVLKELYDRMNTKVEVWMHPKTKEDFFNQLMYDKVIIDRTDDVVGRKVQKYVCEYGEVPLYTSPHISVGTIYFINPERIEIRPLRPFTIEELAKTGDFMQMMIVGEYTFKVENANLMAKFTVTANNS